MTFAAPLVSRNAATAASRVLQAITAGARPLVMGVLNVTPDSFSDGGHFFDPERAIEHGRAMVQQGADILDIGAESTRPYGGAEPVSAEQERARLEPVLPALLELDVPVSIDTMKAEIADWALASGAAVANDVWGLQRDPGMARVVAARGVPVIVMHNRDEADPEIDIMADIAAFFGRSLALAEAAGIPRTHIVLDPGIGFGKTPEQSIQVLGRIAELRRFGFPLLVGASRKRFIGTVVPSQPGERLGGSIAAHLLAVQQGAAIVRVHDVAATVQALRVANAIGHARCANT